MLSISLVFSVRAENILIAGSDCKALTRHQPESSVTYKSGVNVRGEPVVPADVDGSYPIDLPATIKIEIGIDLADRLGIRRATSGGQAPDSGRRALLPYEGKGVLGEITVTGTDVFWNGKLLSSDDAAALSNACRDAVSQ